MKKACLVLCFLLFFAAVAAKDASALTAPNIPISAVTSNYIPIPTNSNYHMAVLAANNATYGIGRPVYVFFADYDAKHNGPDIQIFNSFNIVSAAAQNKVIDWIMQHPYYDGVYGTSVTRHRIRLGYREEWRAHNFVFWNNIYVNGVPESLPTESVNLNEYEGDLVKKLAAVVIYATVAPFGGELDAYHYIADNEDLQFVGDIADIDYPEHVLYTYDTVSAIQDPITKKWIYTFNNLTQVYPAKSLPLY